MITDIFASLISITKGLHRDNRTERDFKELNNRLKTDIQYKAAPLFTIEFPEKPFGAKRKYFKSLIDIEATSKFNKLIEEFADTLIEAICVFNYQVFYSQYRQFLIDVKKYIDNHNFQRESLKEENTYIIQYLKANMIWLYMELQERFSNYGSEDEMTIEEIYQYYFEETLNELEIKPSEIGKITIPEKIKENPFKPIESDLPHRPTKDKVLNYRDIVQHSKSLARAEEMMFEAGLIDTDYNFISNTAKSNKSVLGIIYFLFIEKDYFNKIKNDPFKRIKSTDIVRFLNNRYNTDARKQFKNFEANPTKRNELINDEYLLKNLPNKIR